MGKLKKNRLPSGSYRVRSSYYDENGVRHLKSFTGATRAIAEALKEEWENDHEIQRSGSMTVLEAVQRYMDLKENVLSPSTLRGYAGICRTYLSGPFGGIDIKKLDSAMMQRYISDLSRTVSPKTVRNAYGLVASAINMFRPDFIPSITLPQKKKPALYCPSDDDVKVLLQSINGTELEKAVLLAAFGPLRRGEISPLTASDLHENVLTINKSMVQDPYGHWIVKTTKTESSIRSILLPDFVVSKLPTQGRLVDQNPNMISMSFRNAIKKAGCPRFRFHDLRHYCASMMHALGIPDIYIQARGGWASNSILRSVYTNVIDNEQRKQDKRILDHFDSLIE